VRRPGLSNVQCDQQNSPDPEQERRKRYGIVVQPVPTLYAHDVPLDPNWERQRPGA